LNGYFYFFELINWLALDHAYNRLLEQKLSSSNGNKKMGDKRLMAHSLVGTPNYIAPEILSRKGNYKQQWRLQKIEFEVFKEIY